MTAPRLDPAGPAGQRSRSSVFFCRYLSVKPLPEAMRMEEEEGEGQGHTLQVDGQAPAPGRAATRLPTRQLLAMQAERGHRPPLEYVSQPPPLVPEQLRHHRGGNCHGELGSALQFQICPRWHLK